LKIYIAAPANVYTGGPTALFQLCYTLRNEFGLDALITFYNIIENTDPIHDNYKRFSCPWISINEIHDNSSDVLIVPETTTHFLSRFHRIKRVIYWLAVDNYIIANYKPKNIRLNFTLFMLKNYINDIPYRFVRRFRQYYYNAFIAEYVKELMDKKLVKVPNVDLHIAQSIYAKMFLNKCNVNRGNIVIIHEPIESEFLDAGQKCNINNKKDIIVWNSRKAYSLAFKLVKYLKKVYKVYEARNIGKEGMLKLLSHSKLFIDIGIHPGRDRPLREAIALWNIALVNNHGGYYSNEDCMVPNEFKLKCYLDHRSKVELKDVLKSITEYISDYHYYIEEFHEFRRYIFSEPELYVNDVQALVSKLL
jgi:hypothetical protein